MAVSIVPGPERRGTPIITASTGVSSFFPKSIPSANEREIMSISIPPAISKDSKRMPMNESASGPKSRKPISTPAATRPATAAASRFFSGRCFLVREMNTGTDENGSITTKRAMNAVMMELELSM